jgi:predicted HicB family RNase H-like nuclease
MQQMSLYIEPELKAKAQALAQAQSRSLNNFINLLIQQAVDEASVAKEDRNA